MSRMKILHIHKMNFLRSETRSKLVFRRTPNDHDNYLRRRIKPKLSTVERKPQRETKLLPKKVKFWAPFTQMRFVRSLLRLHLQLLRTMQRTKLMAVFPEF